MLMSDQQPMKMAAADAVFETGDSVGMSLFATGDLESNPEGLNRNIEVPGMLSLLATGSFNGEVEGINNLNERVPGGVRSRRVRADRGDRLLELARDDRRRHADAADRRASAGTCSRKGKLESSKRFLQFAVLAAALPFIANTFGWIFTEMGRQPWVVFGMLKTSDANSPAVSSAEVWITLVGFTLLYGVLAVFAGRIFLKIARKGTPDAPEPDDGGKPDLVLAY